MKHKKYKYCFSKTGHFVGRVEVKSWVDQLKTTIWIGLGMIPVIVGLFYMLSQVGILSFVINDSSMPNVGIQR